MGSRRPPAWVNVPNANALPRGYVTPAQAPLSPPLSDYYGSYDPIEEEIDDFMPSNVYTNGPQYGFNQFQGPGQLGVGEASDHFGHQPGNYLEGQEEDVYYPHEGSDTGQEQYQFEPPGQLRHTAICAPTPTLTHYASATQDEFGHSQASRYTSTSYPRPSAPIYAKEPPPGSRNGTRLVPVSQLPDLYRGIFKKYGTFNAVQSACFKDIMNGTGNLVVSAPTGSGKTVLFELAIIQMQLHGMGGKCVYIAPTKALCSEKFSDWSEKFEPLGLKCYELTGDTASSGHILWIEAKNASIIITTGEKWDSVTRSWKDHQETLNLIRLFLVDEVHVLGESRGSTLEVVVSRMKIRSSATRFILVSATIPNIDDIAAWISSDRASPAKVLQFGEEYRPCRLTRHVVGVPRRKDCNSFMFDRSLDAKLYSVIETYSVGKPVLIFVSTRKGVFSTAELLSKCYEDAESKRLNVPWSRPPRINAMFKDKRLGELATVGIGVHHAGLDVGDRKSIERLYIEKSLRVLVATSTLAVGVNLPAHFVIIKGVQLYQNGVSLEYSDLDIMQMLGRAGRPQFDTEGVAVIMCEQDLVAKYQSLTQGTKVLESYLHNNLAEHLNSEIGLGTITNVESAKGWIRGSFLYQRVRKNPNYYAIGEDHQSLSWQERMDNIIVSSVKKLQDNQLVKESNGGASKTLVSTEFGEIMSKFYIRHNTMVDIIASQKNGTLRDLLELVSRCEEFSENKIRQTEKTTCSVLRRHPDIRFEMKKVDTTADKVFVLIQAVLSGISLNAPEFKTHDCQLYMEAAAIFRHVNRLAAAIVEVGITNKDGRQIKFALELQRCLAAKAWEDRAIVLRQIDSLGEKSIKILAEHGITTMDKLRTQDPLLIESLLNRRNGFGYSIIASADAIPRYHLEIKELRVWGSGGKSDVEVELSISCALANAGSGHKKQPSLFDATTVLTISSDYDFIDFRRIQTRALKMTKVFNVFAHLTKPSQSILVIIASEKIAGSSNQVEYKPNMPASEFPVPRTRPSTSAENDLEGLEDDPDFWKMGIDDTSDDRPKPEPIPEVKQKIDVRQPSNRVKKTSDSSDARKLPNGNYECNHNCHDKGTCRHLCCRQGLPAPPGPPKKPKDKEASTIIERPRKEAKEKKPGSTVKRLHKISSSVAKDVKKLDDLQKHHHNASVSQSLGLSAGQRLKLEPTTGTNSKKEKQQPTYDLSFADLGESSAQKTGVLGSDELLNSDDEIPESIVVSLASGKQKPPRPEPPPLKRALTIISLSSDDDDVQPPPAAQPSKRPKKAPSLADEQLEVEGSDVPLFVSSEHDDYTTGSSYSAPNLMDGIEEPPKLVTPESSNTMATVSESNEEETEHVDEFADFQEWLNSGRGSVVVV